MKSILTILVTVFLMQNTYFQGNKESIDIIVNEIKNNLTSFQKIEEHKDSLGSRCVYLDNNKLKMISVVSKENGIKKKVEWYFNADKFVYGEQSWIAVNSQETSNNQKVYFDNEQLIYYIKNNIVIDSSQEEFKTTNTELKAYVAKLKQNY